MEESKDNLRAKRPQIQAALDRLNDPKQSQDHHALDRLKEASEYRAILDQADDLCAFLQKEWETRQQFTLLLQELAETSDAEMVEEKLKRLSISPIDWKEKVDALLQVGAAFSQRGMQAEANHIWMQAEHLCQSKGRDEGGFVDPTAKRLLVAIYSSMGAWEKAKHIIATTNGSATPTEALVYLATALAQAHFWKEAEHICATISPLWRQVGALANLGVLSMQRGEYEQAQILWRRAEQVAAKCTFRWHQARSFAELGAILAKAGEKKWAQHLWKKAEEVCHSIKTKSPQVLGFCSVATALLRIGEQEQAKKLEVAAEHISMSNPQTVNSSVVAGWSELCLAFAEAGCWEETERICTTVMATNALSAERDKERVRETLAVRLASAGHWEKAEQMADSLPLDWEMRRDWRIRPLSHISTALSRRGEREQANRLWKKVVQICLVTWEPLLLDQTTIQPEKGQEIGQWQRDCLKDVSDVLAYEGTQEDVKQVLQCIQNEWQRLWLLNELAITLIQEGEWNEAYQASGMLPNEWYRAKALGTLSAFLAQAGLWQDAERICLEIRRPEDQARNLMEGSRILVLSENIEPARSFWNKVQQICPKLPSEKMQSNILRTLGQDMLNAKMWKDAEQTYRSIPETEKRDEALIELTIAFIRDGFSGDAERIHSFISSAEHQAYAYRDMAQELSRKNECEKAEQLWEKAAQVAISIPEKVEQALVLNQLGIARYQQGEEKQALHLWKKAEQVCGTIRKKEERQKALEHLSTLLGDFGEELVKDAMWQKAEFVFVLIPNGVLCSTHLCLLAEKLAAMGQGETALGIWERTYLHSQSFAETEECFYALWLVGNSGIALREQERGKQALKMAAYIIIDIYANKRRMEAFDLESAEEFLYDLTKGGLWHEAARVCEVVFKNKALARSLEIVGEAFAQEALWHKIEASCANISDEIFQGIAYRALVEVLIKANDLEEAKRVFTDTKDIWERIVDLGELETALARAGIYDGAN